MRRGERIAYVYREVHKAVALKDSDQIRFTVKRGRYIGPVRHRLLYWLTGRPQLARVWFDGNAGESRIERSKLQLEKDIQL